MKKLKNKTRQIRNIWMITREYGSFAGAGGVRDVVEQLSSSLSQWTGRKVSVVLPLYGFMDLQALGFQPLADSEKGGKQLTFDIEMNYTHEQRREKVVVWIKTEGRKKIYGLESRRFSEKNDVYVYTDRDETEDTWKKSGSGHYDYFAMNILLQKAALEVMIRLDEHPDVIHCHDGHTALLPVMMRENSGYRTYFRNSGVLVTIHNGGRGYHQEIADLKFARAITGLDEQLIRDNLLEDNFDPFLAASGYAVLNAVSENYAHELQHSVEDDATGWLGHTLFARGITIEGVTNGIDPNQYDLQQPEVLGIPEGFDPREGDLGGKKTCRRGLVQLLGAANGHGLNQAGHLAADVNGPLFTFVGRVSSQKGTDILAQAIGRYLEAGGDGLFVILGSGDQKHEEQLVELAQAEGGRVCFLKGFSSEMANKVFAAGDFFLIPSRFEPCGLTDFIAQLFGNLPIVHHVGGLVKVVHGETGFSYNNNSESGLAKVMFKAAEVFEDKAKINKMQKAAVLAIEKKYTWKMVMKRYLPLYGRTPTV